MLTNGSVEQLMQNTWYHTQHQMMILIQIMVSKEKFNLVFVLKIQHYMIYLIHCHQVQVHQKDLNQIMMQQEQQLSQQL